MLPEYYRTVAHKNSSYESCNLHCVDQMPCNFGSEPSYSSTATAAAAAVQARASAVAEWQAGREQPTFAESSRNGLQSPNDVSFDRREAD